MKRVTQKQRMYRKVSNGYAYFMQSPPQQFDDMTFKELSSEYKALSAQYVELKRKALKHIVPASWKARAARAKAIAINTNKCISVRRTS